MKIKQYLDEPDAALPFELVLNPFCCKVSSLAARHHTRLHYKNALQTKQYVLFIIFNVLHYDSLKCAFCVTFFQFINENYYRTVKTRSRHEIMVKF